MLDWRNDSDTASSANDDNADATQLEDGSTDITMKQPRPTHCCIYTSWHQLLTSDTTA